MKGRILLMIIILFALMGLSAKAQTPTWQWGKGGGDAQTSQADPFENVMDIAIDKHGNIYMLCNVMHDDCYMAGNQITGYGYNDFLISSF